MTFKVGDRVRFHVGEDTGYIVAILHMHIAVKWTSLLSNPIYHEIPQSLIKISKTFKPKISYWK